ncbi:thiol reductant ABC exporter subunit CydD [Facilibium subflavum]|uniref:thiol reductant ABC exporter subunit CydD n=1 Tax=Facilibium subflavum TaxID=2219058 RepID=UPI000E64D5B8|nr:thiol reductant ABC exporter subunit CydD [Facilibium subflavum]
MSVDIIQKKSARAWLRKIASPGRRWVQATILISFLSGLLLITQLYLLAHICYAAFIEKMGQHALIYYFVGIGVIVIVRACLAWLKEVVGFKTAGIVKKQLREDIIVHLNKLGPVKIGGLSHGEIISAAMEQVEGVNNFLIYFLPQMTLAGLMPLAILVFIFPQSIICGMILLVCAPLIPLFMMLVGFGAEGEQQKHFKTLARMSAGFLDTLQGLTTLRLFNRGKSHANTIFQYSDQYRIKTMKVLKIAFLSSAVLEVFSAASIALVAIYLGMGFINAGSANTLWWSLDNMTLQGGLFILLLAPEFFLPLRELSTHYHAKAEAVGAAIELQKLFALKPEQDNGDKTWHTPVQTITFNHLHYTYKAKATHALLDVSFTIKKGEKVAIVGPSGAGKTTLLNLLLKFIHTNDQEIIIDRSVPLNHIAEASWLQGISWLGQSTGLIKGTIRANLKVADANADDDALWQALEIAHLGDTVKRLPMQLDTEIGEQSLGLSGGQAQRLGLARAYLKPCQWLLLDEPTASLDTASEKIIIDSLVKIWHDKTVVMLTHRLDFLAKMDTVIVMDEGRIIQKGDLQSLLQDKTGLFSQLYAFSDKEDD